MTPKTTPTISERCATVLTTGGAVRSRLFTRAALICDRPCFLQARDVIGRRLAGKSTRWNETVAIAEARVTWGAINVEALAAALENYFGDRERHNIAGIGTDLAGVEIRVGAEIAAGYRAFNG